VDEGEDDPQQCAEPVDGSNSPTCGDYIADTPADPSLWNGCSYTGGTATGDGNDLTVDISRYPYFFQKKYGVLKDKTYL
jgi:hypothetical protein